MLAFYFLVYLKKKSINSKSSFVKKIIRVKKATIEIGKLRDIFFFL